MNREGFHTPKRLQKITDAWCIPTHSAGAAHPRAGTWHSQCEVLNDLKNHSKDTQSPRSPHTKPRTPGGRGCERREA